MLIKFKVQNFRSFKNETILDMTKTSYKEHSDSTIDMGNEKLLSVAAVYGANASGKSNLIDALKYMLVKCIDYKDIKVYNHILDKDDSEISFFTEKDKPTHFEIDFKFDNEYRYGFLSKKGEIVEEYLYVVNNDEYEMVYERSLEDNVLNLNEELSNLRDVLSKVNSKITLASFIFENFDVKTMEPFNLWVLNVLLLMMKQQNKANVFIHQSNSLKMGDMKDDDFIDYLRSFDNTIKNVQVEENEIETKIFIIREVNGVYFSNDLMHESKGTIKMANLYTVLIDSIKNGIPVIIDELDTSLHPLLLRLIIQMFHKNDNKGQLIMTLHDVSVLTKDLLRRDEVWFVEKKQNLESELYSLVELRNTKGDKIRNDATYYKDYLNGYYGAIPSLKRFDNYGKR